MRRVLALADLRPRAATLKVIVVGNGGVGKTSLTTRFAKGIWTDSYKKTIGAHLSAGASPERRPR